MILTSVLKSEQAIKLVSQSIEFEYVLLLPISDYKRGGMKYDPTRAKEVFTGLTAFFGYPNQ